MNKSIIDVKNLSKKFPAKSGKQITAVDNISFQVQEGEIFGFLGPNGAGKSTTIGMLCTLVKPSGGKAVINNFDAVNDKDDVRKSIGLVFQDPSLDDQLTAEENLRFHAELYGVSENIYKDRLEEVLKLVELLDRKDSIAKTFSGGMKRRLEIARGLIHYPKVLFLDEPTLGLDPQTRVHLWEYILKLKKDRGMTIFMTTHYMNEAEYCDRIAIIDNGKIVAIDTPANLKKLVGKDIIMIKSPDKEKLQKELKEKLNQDSEIENDLVKISVSEGEKALPQICIRFTGKIDSLELRKPTLEDVFLKLTGKKIRDTETDAKNTLQKQMHTRGMRH